MVARSGLVWKLGQAWCGSSVRPGVVARSGLVWKLGLVCMVSRSGACSPRCDSYGEYNNNFVTGHSTKKL